MQESVLARTAAGKSWSWIWTKELNRTCRTCLDMHCVPEAGGHARRYVSQRGAVCLPQPEAAQRHEAIHADRRLHRPVHPVPGHVHALKLLQRVLGRNLQPNYHVSARHATTAEGRGWAGRATRWWVLEAGLTTPARRPTHQRSEVVQQPSSAWKAMRRTRTAVVYSQRRCFNVMGAVNSTTTGVSARHRCRLTRCPHTKIVDA